MLMRAPDRHRPWMTRRSITAAWLDKCLLPGYLYVMSRVRTILLSAFVALLALSTVAHAASSSTMALDMAMAEGGAMSMADCQGCPEDGDTDAKAVCDLVCTAPVVAALKGVDVAQPTAALLCQDRPLGMTLPRGLLAPPDPFPPRPLI